MFALRSAIASAAADIRFAYDFTVLISADVRRYGPCANRSANATGADKYLLRVADYFTVFVLAVA